MAVRQMARRKSHSLINIVGLGVGIASFFLILQYVNHELRYDQFHPNKESIFRVAYKQYENNETINITAKNFMGLGAWMEDQFPEVEKHTRFWKIPANAKFLLQYQGKLFNEAGKRIVADSTFFSVFPALLQKGNPETALRSKHSLVISERVAKKIFGSEDPIGKIIASSEFNDQYEVTGILKDVQGNSHLAMDFITRQDYSWDDPAGNWEGPWRFTYAVLNKDVDVASFQDKLNRALQALVPENPRIKDVSVFLQPVTDIYLHSNLKDELNQNGSSVLVYLLLVIACVIMIIAWVNYINLETSRFISRMKEVGVRRISGSGKFDLVLQFIVEYFCVNTLSMLLAGALLVLTQPYVVFYTGIPIEHFSLLQPKLLIGCLLLFGIGCLLMGAYPAILLAKINLVATLKGKFLYHSKSFSARKVLLTFQFVSSLVLIAFVLIVHRQLDFMKTSNKKIDLDRIISVINPTVYTSQEQNNKGEGGYINFTTWKNKLLQNPSVVSVSASSAIPGEPIGFTYTNLFKRNMGDPYDPTSYKLLFIDYEFISTYGLKLKAGRNYSINNGEDENWSTLILNESAIRSLNIKSAEEAIGQEVYFMVDNEWNPYKIIGVVEDYHHEAVKKAVFPTIFFLHHNKGQQVYYSIKLGAESNPKEALNYLEATWKEVFPNKPFEYFFLDEHYDQQFKAEVYFGRIFTLFAGVALFIAGLGILGITLFETQARLKEISIRKVLGASARSLVLLFSGNHIRIVLLSTAVATPLIYVVSSQWLSTYPARIEFSFLFLMIPMLVVLVMVGITSGLQIMKTTQTNPVNHLKEE
jgi:putative ABC transport system permease protein